MNKFLTSFIKAFKSFDRGDLANYPDPAPPSDLGNPLTQAEIDWVKSLKKEMDLRFDPPPPTCTEEKISPAITDTTSTSFTLSWTQPVGYSATQVQYRVTGATDWEVPNASGNASGYFFLDFQFVFTAGFTPGTSYDIIVRNQCPNGILSPGIIRTAIAT